MFTDILKKHNVVGEVITFQASTKTEQQAEGKDNKWI